ncbi:heavy-metal-associated domain-containing protein [Paenibacillus sp. SAF-054]|uniref:heavy-metal-associated domain-containing protein n=1 Tax=unclassified Paenibacillus TaxID=185978 RepID=UPI003F7F24A5
MQETTMKVAGMNCRSCVRKIENALGELGVKGHVNFDDGSVHVIFNEAEIRKSDIEDVIRSKGYQVTMEVK